MKISKLHINQYRHLENLTFDFTYPTDYKDASKAGKPLDKICFIGQSATGKTGLLELIYKEIETLYNLNVGNQTNVFLSENEFSFVDNCLFEFNLLNEKLKINGNELVIEKVIYEDARKNGVGASFTKYFEFKFKSYYLKANLISDNNIELFTHNPVDFFEKYPGLNSNINLKNNGQIVFFDNNVNPAIWLSILKDILIYRKKFTQKMSELIHKGLLANQKKLSSEFEKWQKENPNQLEDFAEMFNPILEKLNLEVDLINTEYSIPIKNKLTDEVIPIQNTSTGTKGLLLSFLPLFKLNSKDSIVLIDEPERSLYPDMQMNLMEYYQNLAPDAQFIVATHSPFIAASFEPEERYILYFDDEGKVAVRRGSSPIGDDPNDMLKNDFGVNYYNKFGEEAYKKYLNLKENLASETDPVKKKELLLETVKLGDTYNF